jgi:hypothetical protein
VADSYNVRADVLKFASAKDRAIAPARDCYQVTPSDTDDLPEYGKLIVANGHSTNVETVTVVPVGSDDDSASVAAADSAQNHAGDSVSRTRGAFYGHGRRRNSFRLSITRRTSFPLRGRDLGPTP